jgi:hypothetical protein
LRWGNQFQLFAVLRDDRVPQFLKLGLRTTECHCGIAPLPLSNEIPFQLTSAFFAQTPIIDTAIHIASNALTIIQSTFVIIEVIKIVFCHFLSFFVPTFTLWLNRQTGTGCSASNKPAAKKAVKPAPYQVGKREIFARPAQAPFLPLTRHPVISGS